MKQKHFEHGNKAGKVLANKLRKNSERRTISEIVYNGRSLSEQKDIKNLLKEYFEKIYENIEENETTRGRIQEYLMDQNSLILNDEERENISHDITNEEIRKAIQSMRINKTPGPDGFPLIYYRKYEEILIPYLKRTMNDIHINGIPDSWKEALIILITKNENVNNDINNYRPISLTNTDYKIYSKIIAERLKRSLIAHIQDDQCGFLPKRQIKDNMRVVLNIIEHFERHNEKKLAMLLIDEEKAFDKLSWAFLLETLKK